VQEVQSVSQSVSQLRWGWKDHGMEKSSRVMPADGVWTTDGRVAMAMTKQNTVDVPHSICSCRLRLFFFFFFLFVSSACVQTNTASINLVSSSLC